MPAYQSREDARRRIHEIAEGLKDGGEHAREADGFKLMYLLGTTEMNVDEAIHALEANERQAGAGETAGRGQGFLDSVLDEMADALRTHDLGDDARLEEDTAYWGRLTGTAAEKIDEARKRRMREESLKQQQVHRELLKAWRFTIWSAASSTPIAACSGISREHSLKNLWILWGIWRKPSQRRWSMWWMKD